MSVIDSHIKKKQRNNTDSAIVKNQQANADSSTKKSQTGNTSTFINKGQLDKIDSNVTNVQQNSTHPNAKNIRQNSTEQNIKRTVSQTKLHKINARKQQQLQKLEEIVHKFNEKSQNTNDLKKASKSSCDKSLIPIRNHLNVNKTKKVLNNCDIDQLISEDIRDMNYSEISSEKVKTHSVKTPSEASETNKKNKDMKKIKMVKEISMSLDSLENGPESSTGSNQIRDSQPVGINMLSCVPCVIHDNPEKKKANRKNKIDTKTANQLEYDAISELKVELLYKNPVISNSVDLDRDPYITIVTKESINSNFGTSIVSPSTSDNYIPDEIEAITDFDNQEITDNALKSPTEDVDSVFSNQNICKSNRDLISEKVDEDIIHNVTEVQFEENYERDSVELSCEFEENKFDDDNVTEIDEIECRHGSGETYTKFTEDPADLEEFMNITDMLLSNDLSEKECSNIDKDVNSLHTPTANSIEAINQQISDVARDESPKHQFSDTFQELKSHLRELLEGAGNTVSEVLKKTDETNKDSESNVNRIACDMEHITVYQLQFYEKSTAADEQNDADDKPRLKLPSITESNKPGDKVECNKKRMKNLYKPKRNCKMLGEQTRSNKEYQTFIVNESSNDNSDGESEASEPVLKLPRIENRRLDYFAQFPFNRSLNHI